MEGAQLVIAFGGFVAAATAAAVAWVQAIQASRKERDASAAAVKAEEARSKAAEAQEAAAVALREANAISQAALAAQKAALPPPWGGVLLLDSRGFSLTNQSSRTIIVIGIETSPAEAVQRIVAQPRPIRVEYGDNLPFRLKASYTQVPPDTITLVWRFEDDDEVQRSTRKL